jgi:hypothetical protein
MQRIASDCRGAQLKQHNCSQVLLNSSFWKLLAGECVQQTLYETVLKHNISRTNRLQTRNLDVQLNTRGRNASMQLI